MESISEIAGAGPELKRAVRQVNTAAAADRLPPHALEMERCVISCALQSPLTCLALLEERRFDPESFYDLRHRTIYAALQRRYTAKDSALDLPAVMQTLKEMNLLEEIGGIAYLNECDSAAPSAANLEYFLGVVQEKWKLRRLVTFAQDVRDRALTWNGTDVDQLLAAMSTDMEQLTAPLTARTEHHIKAVIHDQVLPLIERHYTRGSTQLDGLPTGKDWYLDKVLLGIADHDYVILAGRPGEGKTSLALNIVDFLASDYVWWREITAPEFEALPPEQRSHPEESDKYFQRHQGIPVGIFTLEMTEESLGFRLVFGRAQVSSATFREGFAGKDDWNRVHKAVAELCKANIYLDGEPDQTIDQIAAKARRWARQYGIKLFVLDYLQLLDGDQNGDSDRVRALRKISKKIVALKKRLGIPWLVLAQMNRNIETAERARRPVMSDLKESGSLEQDADKIVILYHPLKGEGIEEDEQIIDDVLTAQHHPKPVPWDAVPRRINALVVKNRNGPTGPAALLFQNNQCRFQDWRQWLVANGVTARAAGERQPELDRTIDPTDIPQLKTKP